MRTGWAFRYKLLFDGTRQILDFVLPGELVGFPGTERLPYMDHSVETVTEMKYFAHSLSDVIRLSQSDASILSALVWMISSEKARAFERLIDIGRRNARERVAHLILELFNRLQIADPTITGPCPFPLTQVVIADSLGLSPVHVNRVIRQFQRAGLATIANHTLTIHDVEALEDICDFNNAYLKNDYHERLERLFYDNHQPETVNF